MRILFAALSLPFPPSLGQRMRNLSLLTVFHAEGHRVTLVSFATPEETRMDLTRLEALCDKIVLVPHPSRATSSGANYLGRLCALAQARPYGEWRAASQQMKKAVTERLKNHAFELIICDEIYQLQNVAPSEVP